MPPELKQDASQTAASRPVPARSEPEYWQSIEQWMDSTQFETMMKNEFPEDASEWLDPVSRRQFLTVMGASVALAGAVGCNPSLKPASAHKVVPHVRQPEQMLPGVPLFFTTVITQNAGVGLGLLVKQVEGRPIKIEGNPNHPGSLGGTDIYAQASILNLYDPDRSKSVLKGGQQAGFEQFLPAIKNDLEKQKAKQGEGVRFLTETVTSPTLIAQIDEFLKRFPKAKWVQYDTISRDNPRKAGLAAFGKYVNTTYNFAKAKVALAIDADFLSAAGPGSARYAREFMAGRKVREVKESIKRGEGISIDKMNRLYAVESMVTNTGAVADHRLTLKPSQIEDFTKALAAKLGVVGVVAPKLSDLAERWIAPLADDLLAAKGASVVVVGDQQPAAIHLLAHAINEKLGAFGSTVVFTEPLEVRPSDQLADMKQLSEDIKANKVEVLFLLGGNPAYDTPADLELANHLAAMKGTKVHFGEQVNETVIEGQCTWHINAANFLETWGDVRAYDGTVSIQQPLIAPLHAGKSLIELFAMLLDQGVNDPLEVVLSTWKKHFDIKVNSGDFEVWWQSALRDGVIAGTAFQPVTVAAVKLDALADKNFSTPPSKGGLEVQFRADPTIYDGRFANNGWLQELPKPITKLTWGNAAIVSPATAAKLDCTIGFGWTGGEQGRSIGDGVTLTVDGRKLAIPVFILPGHADDVITLHLGFGRRRVGKVGSAEKTFDTYQLRTTTGFWSNSGAEVTKTGEKHFLACTQGQHAMESRRPVRHATVAEFKNDHEFAQVPAASAAEYKELRALTPGTPEDFERLGKKHPYATDHGEHKHSSVHDKRIIPLSLYPKNPQPVNGEEASKTYRRWGMAIDLGACTGCTACVAACVSENNIPVVGKDTVTRGRAMHWIRIDRYFSIPGDRAMDDELGSKDVGPRDRAERIKDSNRIRTHFQPVVCQQCEKAPCEVVCPVGATVHSADGLNDMAYNRCVGTRYCSNNCPYKVRRFNFIQYSDYTTDSLKLMNNPDVTVRTRGVMEKCTYCVQRIRGAEIETEREFDKRRAAGKVDAGGRPKIMDGEIVTACQAACPTGAITFGDINDLDSAVLRAKAEDHNYGLLAELNTSPRTSYLAAIRNPNPAMPKGA